MKANENAFLTQGLSHGDDGFAVQLGISHLIGQNYSQVWPPVTPFFISTALCWKREGKMRKTQNTVSTKQLNTLNLDMDHWYRTQKKCWKHLTERYFHVRLLNRILTLLRVQS